MSLKSSEGASVNFPSIRNAVQGVSFRGSRHNALATNESSKVLQVVSKFSRIRFLVHPRPVCRTLCRKLLNSYATNFQKAVAYS